MNDGKFCNSFILISQSAFFAFNDCFSSFILRNLPKSLRIQVRFLDLLQAVLLRYRFRCLHQCPLVPPFRLRAQLLLLTRHQFVQLLHQVRFRLLLDFFIINFFLGDFQLQSIHQNLPHLHLSPLQWFDFLLLFLVLLLLFFQNFFSFFWLL